MKRQYVIELDEVGYLQLMQLVLKYGTGTGNGGWLSSATRVALADAEVRTIRVDTTKGVAEG